MLGRVSLSFEYKKMKAEGYYEDPTFNKILQGYQERLGNTSVHFPIAGLQVCKLLRELSGILDGTSAGLRVGKLPMVPRQGMNRADVVRRFTWMVDVFYDHFLSISWKQHSRQALDDFLTDVYTSFDAHQDQLPTPVLGHLYRMRAENWLGSYRDIAGIRLTLERISRRFRRPVALGSAITELEENYGPLRADFAEFFPELRAHVESQLTQPG